MRDFDLETMTWLSGQELIPGPCVEKVLGNIA